MNNGWIKIHRQILEWEWWNEPETFRLFFYLLIKANHKDGRWKGAEVKRGELITGRKQLSKELGMSEQAVRTSLTRLKSTNEITSKTTNKYSLIKLNNYDTYQQDNQPANQRVTNKQPATNHKQEYKNNKNEKKIVSKDTTAKPKVRRQDIDGVLVALKQTIGIEAFVDSNIERNMARHCIGLIAKIGKDEFRRRLGFLLADSFHSKNCNKIKYVYNNIKGFKEQFNPIASYD